MRTAAIDAAVARGVPPAWLLAVTMPSGDVLRVATRAITLESAGTASGPWAYHPGLAGVDSYEETVDLWAEGGAVSLAQASVTVASAIDLVGLAGDWMHVATARVELALAWEGIAWEERIVLLAGRVASAEWGREHEESRLVLEATPPPSSATIGDASRDAGVDYAGAQDNVGDDMTALDGTHYTWVIGEPESVPAQKIGDTPLAGTNFLVLCGHELPGGGTVAVSEDGGTPASYAVASTIANPSGAWAYVSDATQFRAANGAYTWTAAASGGIARADATDQPTRSAADVVRYLLAASELDVDWARSLPALDRLRAWRVGLWGDEEVAAIDVLRESVLPWLPLVEVQTARGVALEVADPLALPLEAHLVAPQHAQRLGRVVTTPAADCRNSFVVEYARDEYLDEYTAVVTIDADTDAACSLSAQLLGTLVSDPVQCPITWDAVTARRIGRSMAQRKALPRRRVTYQVAADLYWLRAGMAIRLTDDEIGCDGQRAVVTTIRRAASMEVDLDLVDITPASAL